jgi:hypothetical protein
MDGKWHVHFGPLDPPDKTVGYDHWEEAVAHAASLATSTIAPRLRWITDPAGERVSQAKTDRAIARQQERLVRR